MKNEDGEKEKDINKKKEVRGKKTGQIRVDKGRKSFQGVIGDIGVYGCLYGNTR